MLTKDERFQKFIAADKEIQSQLVKSLDMELIVDHMLKAPAVRNSIATHFAENDQFAEAVSSILYARGTNENRTGGRDLGWRKEGGKTNPRAVSSK